MDKLVGLRIDVDTATGYRKGVDRLLNVLRKYRIKASFFIPFGYDNPIRLTKRIFSESGFLKRLFRLKRCIFYNIFSKGDMLFQKMVDYIDSEGHEIELHGYHHFDWQLHLYKWSKERIYTEITRGMNSFRLLVGEKPSSFASPGWVVKDDVFLQEEKFSFAYCSDTRGKFPFYPEIRSKKITTLQIPVTLPTLDELIALGKTSKLLDIRLKPYDVYCAHAEFDGLAYIKIFEEFVKYNIDRGFTFVPLIKLKEIITDAPFSRVIYRKLPGRTNLIAYQKT